MPSTKRIAFYYPGPIWHHETSIYNSLLFFDGVALLVPDYLKDKQLGHSPILAHELDERGLLHQLDPAKVMDTKVTESLAASLDVFVNATKASGLPPMLHFHELSYSRLGGAANQGIAEAMFNMLKSKGLARDSEDGVSIPMHPMVRNFMLVGLAQHLRHTVKIPHAALDPYTDRPDVERALSEMLGMPAAPSAHRVVSIDAGTLDIDLTGIPLDEILDFKDDYGAEFRRYAIDAQAFAALLSQADASERPGLKSERQALLKAEVANLQKRIKPAWRKAASLSLGVGGAWWAIQYGDWLGAAIGAAGIADAATDSTPSVGAYSYLVEARRFAST